MMVKNEEDHILKTLNSVRDHVETYVILDTGSTDGTVAQAEAWCAEHHKHLFLRATVFENFETTRNELLVHAEHATDAPWLLLADASDEFRGDWTVLESFLVADIHAILIQQEWESENSIDTYMNYRCIRNRAGWRYHGVVHEYLARAQPVGEPTTENRVARCPASLTIYQDRRADGNKSAARFKRDYEMLKKALNAEPDRERNLFYMGQTCRCLDLWAESSLYYERYLELGSNFTEEKFQAKLNIGLNLMRLGNPSMALEWLQGSYEMLQRAEPLVEMADYFIQLKKWHLAYLFLRRACSLSDPENTILFVDMKCYQYRRWFMMGIAGFYAGHRKEGHVAALMAVTGARTTAEREQSTHNVRFYENDGRAQAATVSAT
jgi:glycosyltransferase involved in cell wall biosynthesis